MTSLDGIPFDNKVWHATANAFIGSWELMSSLLFAGMGVRFVSWRFFEHGGSPFDGGLFSVMRDIYPVPEAWAIFMFASVPAAMWFTMRGSMKMRIMHRFFVASVWGMFAGASIPAGLERSLTTFGITMLWTILLIAICQTYALVDRAIADGSISVKGER